MEIDRVTDLSALTLENRVLADTVAAFAAEYKAESEKIDAAETRKKAIMATLRPLLESQGIKTVRSEDWTVSRTKGREGKCTFKLTAYSLTEDALPAEVILTALSPDVPIDCVSIPKLVQAGAKLDSINPFIHKAEDGTPFYTLRGKSEKGEK